ncbi:MAG: hypothetical protein H6924_05910 [Alphaproteobacteria bacterium]|nr:hypothetical protein [Alphaproteobacteria bacterium]
MKHLVLAALLLAAGPALAQAPTQGAVYSVATTRIGALLDVPALKAIFLKYLPEIATNPQIDEGRDLTLPEIVQYAPDVVTPDKLSAIDAELKAVPQQ